MLAVRFIHIQILQGAQGVVGLREQELHIGNGDCQPGARHRLTHVLQPLLGVGQIFLAEWVARGDDKPDFIRIRPLEQILGNGIMSLGV